MSLKRKIQELRDVQEEERNDHPQKKVKLTQDIYESVSPINDELLKSLHFDVLNLKNKQKKQKKRVAQIVDYERAKKAKNSNSVDTQSSNSTSSSNFLYRMVGSLLVNLSIPVLLYLANVTTGRQKTTLDKTDDTISTNNRSNDPNSVPSNPNFDFNLYSK